jgi:hypothetical protein
MLVPIQLQLSLEPIVFFCSVDYSNSHKSVLHKEALSIFDFLLLAKQK